MSEDPTRRALVRRLYTLLRLPEPSEPEMRQPDIRPSGDSRATNREAGIPGRITGRRGRDPQGSAPSSGRILWESEPEVRTKSTKIASSTSQVDWAGENGSGLPDPASLVGLEDAFDHTPLQPGERVAFCIRDKVAYHMETWEFLRSQNRGKCCICGRSNSLRIVTLPALPGSQDVLPRSPSYTDAFLTEGKIISLQEVPDFLNRAVIVQEEVHEVYQTKSTGTYFIRFQPRAPYEPVFSGFKVVIFNNYLKRWVASGISVEDYRGQIIRVRGVVQEHPKWGIEILVNSPRVIEIIQPEALQSDQSP